ncbi:TonB-dependent receptor [Myxococcota bacterium]|nr:TonB-dependent receptor [Myxococcota bacterium]
MIVRGRRPVTAASSIDVRDRDFLLRPHMRPADILAVTPGLYVVQHAGGGKANQYFLRGFDADHGTDIAFSLDGVPVNLVSHGHGQGFADWHFLIPEVVERIHVSKGPYLPEHGDFATAGAIELVTKESEDEHSAQLTAGAFGTLRALVRASPHVLDPWHSLVAAEYARTDGPFVHGEDLERVNVFAKVTRDLGAGSRLSFTLTSYGAAWNASGQLPEREVNAGRLDRFDSIDPTEGGSSQRHSIAASYRTIEGDRAFELSTYIVQYQFRLYSNFTFFSADPERGDQIEQADRRTIAGLRTRYETSAKLGSVRFDTAVGAQVRTDGIENGLFHTQARRRLDTRVDAEIRETSLGLFAREDVTLTPWLRLMGGARVDSFVFDVNDRLGALGADAPITSGVRQQTRVSPKASVVVSPLSALDLFFDAGLGFHSNDARGTVRDVDPVTPLTAARGYEAGFRARLLDRLDLAGAAFLLDLDSEIVWVGDGGFTEASGATRRTGLEGELRLRILDWLFADVDASLTNGVFRENAGNGTAIALAPKLLVQAGLSARHPSGLFGRLGVLHVSDRPATEDEALTARGFTRADLTLGARADWGELSIAIQNLTDADVREAQFANVSRLPSETSAASCPAPSRAVVEGGAFLGCEDVHFTPGAPINVLATATLYF